jgi:hypothetical protein
MVTKDPIEIWEIQKTKSGRVINLVARGGQVIPKEVAAREILNGQKYAITSEDGDISFIDVIGNSDHTLRTIKDDTELNNLTGNTNLKISIVDNDGKEIEDKADK